MEKSINGVIAGTRGIRVAQTDMATVKPWAPARPAVLAGLPVFMAPVARVAGAELCPSPDRTPVTPFHQPMNAFTENVVFGLSAEGYAQPSKGSHRPAPPG